MALQEGVYTLLSILLLSAICSSQSPLPGIVGSPSFPSPTGLAWMDNCKETKGNEAVDDVIIKWNVGLRCVNSSMQNTKSLFFEERYRDAAVAACGVKLELQECLEPVAAAVDNCLIDFGKSDLEVQRTGVIQGAEFLCANVAKLEELMSKEFVTCMFHGKVNIETECKLGEFVNAMVSYGNTRTIFNSTVCGLVKEVKICLVNTAKKCGVSQARTIEGLLDTMKAPCNSTEAV